MLRLMALALLCVVAYAAFGQVPPPKYEQRWKHLFGEHRDQDNLEQRSTDLSCALVLIVAGDEMGTGFYISADGDIATAAHVLGNKLFIPTGAAQMQIVINGPSQISIRDSSSTAPTLYQRDAVLENNVDAWSADVALLKTKRKPPCWLRTADDKGIHTGQHVLSLGFPGLAFGSLSMYSGIVSGRLHSGLPIGKTVFNQPITSNVDFIRVQMPISPGLSGAPVVDDENRALGVVTSAGAWTQDLDLLLQWERVREKQPTLPGPARTVDFGSMLGELAETFHDYVSPGYGDSVPMHYLRKAPAANPQPAPHGH